MQLRLHRNESWPVIKLHRQELLLAPGSASAATAELFLAYGWLSPRPDAEGPWIDQALGVDLGAGFRVVKQNAKRLETDSGWPLFLVFAQIERPDGQVVEQRLGAFYVFLEQYGVALVRARNAAVLNAHLEAIVRMLRSGQPDWQGDDEIVALSDLYRPLEQKTGSD
jgi:hypothetical protein